MKKIVAKALGLITLLMGVTAQAATWSSGTSEVLTGNAQIDCDSGICIISPTDPQSSISERLDITSPTSVSQLLFPANDGNDNTYIINVSDSTAGLQLNTYTMDDIQLDGNIINTGSGYGVYSNGTSTVNNDFIINGNVITQGIGTYLRYLTIGNDLILDGNLTSTNNNAMYIYSSTITRDVNINGVLTSGSYGLYLYSTDVGNDVNINGDIASSNNGVYIQSKGITGDLNITGTINSTNSNGIYLYSASVNNIVNSGTVTGSRGLYTYGTVVINDIINTGKISSENNEVLYLRGATVNSILNDTTGEITRLVENGNAIYLYSGTTITNGIINNGIINGHIVNNGTIGGITFGETSEFNGRLYNSGTIASTDGGAAITYLGTGDNVLDYRSNGTLSGGIDMGAGNDTLNLVSATVSDLVLSGVEILNAKDSTFKSTIDDTNNESVLIDMTSVNSLTLSNTNFYITTTDEILDADIDNTFTLMETLNGVNDLSSLTVTFDGITYDYAGYIYASGNQLMLEYGEGLLTINGSDSESVDLQSICTDGICTVTLKTNAIDLAKSISKIDINGIVDTAGITDVIIQGESTVGAGDQVTLYYSISATENYIQLTGENYTNVTIDTNIRHTNPGSSAHMIDFAAGSILNGNFTLNGDIGSYREYDDSNSYYGYGVYMNSGSQVTGNLEINGDVEADYGFYAVTSIIDGNLILNGDWFAESYYAVYASSMTVGNDFIINADITSYSRDGAYIYNGSVGNDLLINGDITADDTGLFMRYLTVGNNVELNGNITGLWSDGVYMRSGSIGGDLINYKKISGYDDGLYVSDQIISGNLINEVDGEIKSSSGNYYAAIYIDDSTIEGDIINKGLVTANNDSLKLVSWDGTHVLGGEINNSGTIEGLHRGLTVMGFELTNAIVNSGTIQASDDWVNTEGGKPETFGIFLLEVKTTGIENTETGVISGQYGIAFGSEHYTGNMFGRVENDTDLTVHNDGQIIGSKYAAIALDIGSLSEDDDAQSYDNTLNYSGRGKLSGATYDIEMGDGNDTVNITNATIGNLKINSAETVNITDSTIDLKVTNETQSASQMELTGTNTLSLTNVMFSLSADGVSINPNSSITLVSASTIITDINTLSMDLVGVEYEADGYFELVTIDGVDQLNYFIEFIGDSVLLPNQPAQVSPTSVNTIAFSAMNTALAMNGTVINIIGQRQTANTYAKLMKNVEFAAASNIQSDINVIFSEEANQKEGIWFQFFGQSDKYDGEVSGGNVLALGYEGEMYGLTIGGDHEVSKDIIAGLAFTYMNGKITGDNNNFETTVSSFQLNAYASYKMGKTFFDGIVGYGLGLYNQERNIGLNTAVADYNNHQLSAQLNVGHVFFATDKAIITPFARTSYINVTQGDYEETNNGMVLAVDEMQIESLQFGGGVEFGYLLEINKFQLMPRLNIEYAAELGDTSVMTTSSLMSTGSNAGIAKTPDMGTNIFRIGAGVTLITEEGRQLSIDYQNETRDNYMSHSFFIKGKYLF